MPYFLSPIHCASSLSLSSVVIETLRKGAIIGLVAVELGWLAVLWLLWLVQGALAARGAPNPSLCGRLTCQSPLLFTFAAYTLNSEAVIPLPHMVSHRCLLVFELAPP
jgi:hypothetical protein